MSILPVRGSTGTFPKARLDTLLIDCQNLRDRSKMGTKLRSFRNARAISNPRTKDGSPRKRDNPTPTDVLKRFNLRFSSLNQACPVSKKAVTAPRGSLTFIQISDFPKMNPVFDIEEERIIPDELFEIITVQGTDTA